MKQLIMDVLDDMSKGQVNFESEAARKMIANTIMAAIKTNNGRKGWVLDLSTLDGKSKSDTPVYEKSDEQKARESWVCEICGKNTYDVDWDYIGSGTNHLGCEIRLEQDENYRKKNWSQKKHEDKVFNEYVEDIDDQAYAQGRKSSKDDLDSDENVKLRDEVFEKQKQLFEDAGDGHMLKVDEEKERMKLVEEIIEGQEGKWIYESPDGGKTVFRRPFSNYDPKYKEEINWETKEPTGRVFTQYPFPPSSNSDEE